MAQHELLVKLGLQSDSFSRNIKNVNNQLKLTDAEFKKLESSTRNFGKSQKDLAAKLKSLKSTQEQLTAKTILYKNKIKELQGEISKSAEKHKKLGEQLKKEKQKLNELAATQGKNSQAYKDQSKKVKELQTEYDKAGKKVENMNLSLQKHKIELARTETELNKLKITLAQVNFQKATAGLDSFANKMNATSKIFGKISKGLTSAGRTLTTGVTAPIVGFGSLAAKTFFDFEHQVRRVNAISSSETMNMGQRFEYLTEQTKKFGRETEWTALDVGKAYEYFAMAGISVEKATASMGPMLSLASIGMLDLGTAADIVTDTMTPFSKQLDSLGKSAKKNGKEFNGAEWMIDRFAATIVNSNTNVGLMGETLKYAGPVVASYGGKFEDLAVAIGTMANAGIKGSMAGTALATGLNRIVKPAKDGKKAMKKYGIELKTTKSGQIDLMGTMEHLREKLGKLDEVERGRAVTAIFGQTAQKGWLSIINADSDAWDRLKTAIQNADGATEEMMEEIRKSGSYGFKVMQSAIQDLLLNIGDALAPALVSVGKQIEELAIKLSNWVKRMHETNPEMLEMIGKMALFAAAAGPVLMVLGSMAKGISVLTGGIGGGIKAFLKFGSKIAETAATASAGTSKFTILASAIGVSGPALIAAAIAAFVGLAAVVGSNGNALAWLQDKWGAFGRVVGGICEFISGVVKLTFGNLLIIISTAGKAIGALLKGKVWEIDDIVKEGNARIATNTHKAWSDITLSTTRALDTIRNSSKKDMDAVNKVFEESLKALPKITKDNIEEVANGFTEIFTSTNGKMLDLSDNTIEILKGTSDTMASLFDGIKGNMNIDEARVRFGNNMMELLNSGKISAEGLQKEFDKAGKLISNNLADSMKRATEETGKILSELGDIARDGLEPVSQDIVSIINGMSQTTVDTIRSMGANWRTILKGVTVDGSMSTQEMNKQILSNLEELGLSTPEKLEKFKAALTKEMEAAKKGADDASKGTKEKVEENVVPDGSTTAGKTKEAMDQNTEAVKQGSEEAEQAATEGGKNTKTAFGESANATPTGEINLKDEVAKAGDQAKEVAGAKGGEVINNMTNSMNTQLPQMSGVTNNISNQLSKIDNIKLGGVTKQLSEVNKWLVAVNKAASPVRNSLNNLCNIPFGNTTRGLSQINQWLNTVKSSATTTRSAMINLTNLPFGNTTKGLSEITKWLKNVTTAAKQTENALKNVTRVTYGSTTKGLSEVKRWLDNVRTSAGSARSYLQSLASVRFGGVTSGLSQVNRWLQTVASSAGRTRSALSSVSAARASVRSLSTENIAAKISEVHAFKYNPEVNKINILSDAPNLDGYSIKNTNLNQRKSIENGIANVYQSSIATANEAVSSTLMQTLLEQNKLLMKLLESDRDIILHNSIEVDGRQIAKSSARYVESELRGMRERKNRFGGILNE